VGKEVAVDGSDFGHAHLGAADKRGNIRRIGIAVADKARLPLGREDRCLEDEAIYPRITQRVDGFNMDPAASLAARQPK